MIKHLTYYAFRRQSHRGNSMHEYYRNSASKIRKANEKYLSFIEKELTGLTGAEYHKLCDEIWNLYKTDMLEYFPYIGGDKASGTKNLTASFGFVAMGEVLKNYGVSLEDTGSLMVLSYERSTLAIPSPVRKIMHKMFTSPRLLNKMFLKKDITNAENAKANPGSFETKTMIPPEEGYSFSYHNLVCPLERFARAHGYGEYMPYICSLDYVMYGVLGVPLYREHTCFEDGDYCDFKLKIGSPVMDYRPPVFSQGKGFK